MSSNELPLSTNVSSKEAPSKEAVLEAAHRLIHQHGLSGFSMRELALHSGLAKATIYHHFQDKRQIFFQVLERDLVSIRDSLIAATAIPGDLPSRLKAVILAFFNISIKDGTMLMSTFREVVGMEAELCTLMSRYREELHRPITELLAEGVQNGEIRPVNLEHITMCIFGILQVYTGRYMLLNDTKLDEKAADEIIDLLLHGLLNPAPGEPQSPPSAKTEFIK
jgi:AcrR family transcriptional regulator